MFTGTHFTDYYREAVDNAKSSIQREKDDYILTVDTQELVEFYHSQIHLNELKIDTSRKKHMETERKLELVNAGTNIGNRIVPIETEIEREIVTIYIPIIPNDNFSTIWELLPSTNLYSGSPDLSYENEGWIYFKLHMKSLDAPYIEGTLVNEIKNYEKKISQYFRFRNKDIAAGEREFKSRITEYINIRKRNINNKKARLESLINKVNIPIRRRKNTALDKTRLNEKELVKRIKPSAKMPEEYTIDRDKVLDIIQYINNQGLQFEKTPSSFSSLGEENLRDILLVSLNSIFEGRATGETFSKKGRSDIYLNLDKGNILVFECKIWGGPKLFHKTINQLLGYLTWRYNYGVVIVFCRNAKFTRILSQTENNIKEHKSYLRGARTITENHYMSINKLREADSKEVEIHYLLYDLYTK